MSRAEHDGMLERGLSMKNWILALLIALGLGVTFIYSAAVAGSDQDQQFMPDTETNGGA